MKCIRFRKITANRLRNVVISLGCAVVLLLQTLPVVAVGASQNVEVTFTKWLINDTGGMSGFVGGDVTGGFAGQMTGFNPIANGGIFQLEALYEITAGEHSFVANIQGKQNNQTGVGVGVLNGVVTEGWLAGSQVHVEFEAIQCPQSPFGCFQGTIRIMSAQN